jgi:hypothetical protein
MALETLAVVSVPYVTRDEWLANGRAALAFARKVREDLCAQEPEEAERARLGIGRLLRWADERVR